MISRLTQHPTYIKICETPLIRELPKTYLFKASKYLFCLSVIAISISALAVSIYLAGPHAIHLAKGALHFTKWTVILSASVFLLSLAVWGIAKLAHKIAHREQQLLEATLPTPDLKTP